MAKIVLFIVVRESGIDKDLVRQHLDDCCASGPADSMVIDRFDAVFFKVAEELGVKLAPRDDPDKSFGPSTSGTILGVHYDTVSWTWAVPQDKLIRLLHDIAAIMAVDEIAQDRIWSVVGKIQHVKPLVPGGGAAAGGSKRSPGHGVGAVGGSWWVYLPWTQAINAGWRTEDYKGLDRVMSALELVGPLLGLCAASAACRNFVVRFWVDNSGSVFIYQKGYSSSCPVIDPGLLVLTKWGAWSGPSGSLLVYLGHPLFPYC